MCIARPLRIKVIDRQKGIAVLEDNTKVKIGLVPEAKEGDYILAQGNLAVGIIDKEEALSIKELIGKIKIINDD